MPSSSPSKASRSRDADPAPVASPTATKAIVRTHFVSKALFVPLNHVLHAHTRVPCRLAGLQSFIQAIKLVDEREAKLRQAFDKFDLDRSGTIDMEELLALLDDVGLMNRLQTDAEEFVRDMFMKYDANSDGVLSFSEFIGLHNSAIDDSLGRRKTDAPPGKRGTLEARKKLLMEKAEQKAAEAARIQRENAEMKERIMAQNKGRDPKSLDAEVEKHRRALALARAEAKAAEKARLQGENAEMRHRIRTTGAATDNDITDDVGADGTVGAGRAEAAAASKARKAAEAKKLAAENAIKRERISSTAPRTVDHLS